MLARRLQDMHGKPSNTACGKSPMMEVFGMNIPSVKSSRRLLGASLVIAALAVAGCGGGGSSSSTSSATSSTAQSSSTSAPASSGSSSSGIPQGPNAGDRDADNQGGPSDGDGNI
jgi:hypothetical protein